MYILREVLKWMFFFITLFVALIFLRWESFLSTNQVLLIKQILMPWYLLFCGLMVWYVFSLIMQKPTYSESMQTKIYIKWFVIWITIWLVLWISYIFIK